MTQATKIPVAFKLRDEEFSLELEDNVWYLTHPRWSLVGSGTTPALAYADLIQEAYALAPVYLSIPAQRMDGEALRLTEFLTYFA